MGLLRAFVVRMLMRNPRDSFVAIVAAAAVAAIVINGLLLQPGPHPAPMFTVRPLPIASNDATGGIIPRLPRPRPAEAESAAQTAPATARPRTEIIADVQRELVRHGFYDGTVDGIYGAKTDAAVRDFEQTSGLKPSIEPSEALLASIVRSAAKAPPAGHAGGRDRIATLLTPHARSWRSSARSATLDTDRQGHRNLRCGHARDHRAL